MFNKKIVYENSKYFNDKTFYQIADESLEYTEAIEEKVLQDRSKHINKMIERYTLQGFDVLFIDEELDTNNKTVYYRLILKKNS